jgi:Glucosamine-6-phosphate isomerases/6-phosphogluconolactonase/Ribulose-phosphate 3 epimerase family
MSVDLVVVADPEDAAARVARLLAEAAHAGDHIVLAGSSTPRRAYELAAGLNGDWSRAEIWWVDERCVAPDDERSNFRLFEESLFSRLAQPRRPCTGFRWSSAPKRRRRPTTTSSTRSLWARAARDRPRRPHRFALPGLAGARRDGSTRRLRVFHYDIGDGQFVPPVTIGPIVLESIAPRIHERGGALDCHLMADGPERHFEQVASAGGDGVTVITRPSPVSRRPRMPPARWAWRSALRSTRRPSPRTWLPRQRRRA